jgi:hypothetical protein
MEQSAESEARDESLDLERFVSRVRGLRTVPRSEIDTLRGNEIAKSSSTTTSQPGKSNRSNSPKFTQTRYKSGIDND